MPGGVSLLGSFGCVPSHPGIGDARQVKPGEDGTALLAVGGRGNEDGPPLISLSSNSPVKGLLIYYPEQRIDSEPAPYPWTIPMQGVNCGVFDVELLNPYQGINTVGAPRPTQSTTVMARRFLIPSVAQFLDMNVATVNPHRSA